MRVYFINTYEVWTLSSWSTDLFLVENSCGSCHQRLLALNAFLPHFHLPMRRTWSIIVKIYNPTLKFGNQHSKDMIHCQDIHSHIKMLNTSFQFGHPDSNKAWEKWEINCMCICQKVAGQIYLLLCWQI